MNNSIDLKKEQLYQRNMPANFKSHGGLASNDSLHGDFLDRTLEPEPDTAGARNGYDQSMLTDVANSMHDLHVAAQNSAETGASVPFSNIADCGIPSRPIQHTRSKSRRNQ